MKRIDTSTASPDENGTGRDGFTNGVPNVTPPTQLDDTWFNHAQEELARTVEGSGSTLDDGDFEQVHAAVQQASVRSVACDLTADYVLRGLTFNLTGTSLTVTRAAGEVVYNGQRYVILGTSNHTLTASRDNYFFFTPNGIDALTVTVTAVVNGAAAPSTPAGTVLFAMVVTNGTDATAVTYYNRGPRIIDENGDGLAMRPQLGDLGDAAVVAALIPIGSGVAIGYDNGSQDGYFDSVHTEELRLRSSSSSLQGFAAYWSNTSLTTTTAGGSVNHTLGLDAADYPDGTVGFVELRVVGFDLTDPTDGYTSLLRVHVHKDGGTWDLDGSGLTPEWEEGAGALAAGVTTACDINSGNLRLVITGHATDAMRWFIKRDFIVSGDS